jgi:hypothetical protein
MTQTNRKHPSNADPRRDQLGKILENYPVQNQDLRRWLTVFLGGLTIFASIGFIVLLVINTWARINIHGRAILLSVIFYPAILYTSMLIAGVLAISLAILFWRDGVILFEKGIVLITAKRTHTWLYADTTRFDTHISRISFGGSTISLRVKIILEDADHQRLVIQNRYRKILELIENLRINILPELIRRCQDHLLMGERLYFHKNLQADQNRIFIKKTEFPYHHIKFSLQNQFLTLYEKDNPKKVLLKLHCHRVRNFDVLIGLLENPPGEDDHSSFR